MNITDVDDKIILRGRQQYLFNKFVTAHPTIDATVLETAKAAVNEHLSDSFNTPAAMAAISDLLTKFNSADKATVNPKHVDQMGR